MNYQSVVAKYREQYKDLTGAERAWTIINAVANEIKTGWGLLYKPSGNNWKSYSIDCLVNFYSREFVDCLVDSEGNAIPSWQQREATEAELQAWRPYVEVINPPSPPVPPEPPVPPVSDDTYTLCVKIYELLQKHFK
jgi:hypothetical protein